MPRKSQKLDRWTRQCSDGRACSGIHDSPRFVPDDVDVCDACLAAQHGLEEVHDGCCCGQYSEHVGYTTESVLKVLRAGVKPRRYYAGLRVEGAGAKAETFIGVYDGDQPRPRTPLEEKAWAEEGAAQWGYARAAELNHTD